MKFNGERTSRGCNTPFVQTMKQQEEGIMTNNDDRGSKRRCHRHHQCYNNKSISSRKPLMMGCLLMLVILCILPNGILSEFNEDSYTRMIDKFGYLKSVISSKKPSPHHHNVQHSDKIEEIFDRIYLQNNETVDYGIVVVIDKAGKILFNKVYGSRESMVIGKEKSSTKTPLTDPLDDIFPISEVSATFTAATSVQLQEKGILQDLTTTEANQYLPDSLKIKREIIGDYSSTLDLPVKISDDNVTLGSLLTHTTGFDSRVVGSCLRVADPSEKNEPEHYLKKYLESMDVPRIRRYDFVSSFSHIGYTMLALIIERMTGHPMKHVLEQQIFKPLNMTSTFDRYSQQGVGDEDRFVLPLKEDATNKKTNIDSQLIHGKIYEDYCWYSPGFSSSVGMYSTPRDMAKWALTHLNYGEIFPSEIDPNISKTRIFSKESAQLMYSEHFRSHPSCSITTGYGWNIEKKSDVKYITAHGSFMNPFFSRLAVFHEQGLGIAILGRGKNTRWDLGFDLFVDRHVDRVPCSMRKSPLKNTTYVDNDLGICAFTLKISSLPNFSDEYHYISKYSGCFVMHEYEHTTWLKFKKEFQKKICVSVEDNHLYISTGESGIQLVALEIPGRTIENDPLFVAGIKDGDDVLIVDGFSDISFEFNTGDESASYITLSSVPFERATPVNFYALLLTIGFSFLICFSFSLLHLSFCIHTMREHNAMYSKRKASILISRVASLQRPIGPLSSQGSITADDSDMSMIVDEEGRTLLYTYGDEEEAMNDSQPVTSNVKSSKIHRFIKIKSIVDGIAIFLMACTSLNNSLALIGIIMNYSLFNQTKLFPQEQFGIALFLFECQLAIVFDFAIVLALIAMIIIQIIHPKGKSRRVWLWVVMYAVSTFIHLVWLAFCIYFNWFGADYQTI